jgi:hypothetical protein
LIERRLLREQLLSTRAAARGFSTLSSGCHNET